VLQALPGQNTPGDVASSLTGGSMPDWLMGSVTGVADGFTKLGSASLWILVAAFVLVGVGGLLGGRIRTVAAWAGIVLGALIWVFGEGFADMFNGQATDPNSGPLLALLGVALLGVAPVAVASDARRTALASVSAVAVVGVGLLLWVNTRPAPVGPPPSLTLTGAYTPVGDGGQVYFTLTNKGDGPDTLTAAGTEFQTATKAKDVSVCADTACSAGETATIPAHASVTFAATGPHLVVHGMGALATGNPPLQLTLTFQRSGVLHVLAPVGSAANLTENDIMTYGFMGGSSPGMGDMSGMPGMSGSPATSMPGMGH
jgi:copper(I)-binding protein